MTLETWLLFSLASVVVLVTPGPVVILTVIHVSTRNFRSVLPIAIGTTIGDAFAITLSLAGIGTALAASQTAYFLFSISGALILAIIGVRTLAQCESPTAQPKFAGTRSAMDGLALTALHPGGYVFYLAFIPLFVDQSMSVFRQLCIMGVTFLLLSIINLMAWAIFADTAKRWLGTAIFISRAQKFGGVLMIVVALITALSTFTDIFFSSA